jgi:hypothetical protein
MANCSLHDWRLGNWSNSVETAFLAVGHAWYRRRSAPTAVDDEGGQFVTNKGRAKPTVAIQVCAFIGAAIGVATMITLNLMTGVVPGGAIGGAIGGGGGAMLGYAVGYALFRRE